MSFVARRDWGGECNATGNGFHAAGDSEQRKRFAKPSSYLDCLLAAPLRVVATTTIIPFRLARWLTFKSC